MLMWSHPEAHANSTKAAQRTRKQLKPTAQQRLPQSYPHTPHHQMSAPLTKHPIPTSNRHPNPPHE